jgi:hypothetical protein
MFHAHLYNISYQLWERNQEVSDQFMKKKVGNKSTTIAGVDKGHRSRHKQILASGLVEWDRTELGHAAGAGAA